ncbi:MAG: hypothetical protein KGL39_39855 [Patescibacteria group bacterium]|nr:hypothetical protein [Patescibacteria group bacterium]
MRKKLDPDGPIATRSVHFRVPDSLYEEITRHIPKNRISTWAREELKRAIAKVAKAPRTRGK